MSYDIDLRAKVEGVDEYVDIADAWVNITWNVRELIEHSSGWIIKNEDNNGLAGDLNKLLIHGIHELENHPDQYRQYEAKNGWGTIESTLRFYKELRRLCRKYPFAYVFVY